MDWNTLLSVALGGLIATIGVILTNRFQSRERDKDRAEQRREAKIQAREKWIERDVPRTMELVEKMLILLGDYQSMDKEMHSLVGGIKAELITNEEFRTGMKSLFSKIPLIMLEANHLVIEIEKLVFSFKEEKISA